MSAGRRILRMSHIIMCAGFKSAIRYSEVLKACGKTMRWRGSSLKLPNAGCIEKGMVFADDGIRGLFTLEDRNLKAIPLREL